MFIEQGRLMNVLRQRVFFGACLLALAACSTADDGQHRGLFFDDNLLHSTLATAPGEVKNAAVLRITPYVDQRSTKNPRLLGANTTRVMGLTGNELVMDRDVAGIVTIAMQNQFKKAGFAVTEAGASQTPTFEVSGIVKELTLNSKDRDDISIVIETSVKELATGKVIWSASVTEKNNRFAGVAGNNKSDLVEYLNHGLRVACGKTVDAVGTFLMATYPSLYNLTPGTKIVAGVTVYSAPVLAAPVLAPVIASAPTAPVATMGVLVVSSKPSRAKVYLDGVYFGMTPLRVELEAGVHRVDVKLDAHKAVSEKVSVRKGEATELELSLKK
jgi:hypothetical protein